MEDLQSELEMLDAKGVDWDRLSLYQVKICCLTCLSGRLKDFWVMCVRNRKDYSIGHICEMWEKKLNIVSKKVSSKILSSS